MARSPALVAGAVLLVLSSLTAATDASEIGRHIGRDPSGSPATTRTPPSYAPGTTTPQKRDRKPDRPRKGSVSVAPLIGQRQQPNIVVIMADDARDDDLRFMPNVRRLIGGQGVRFTNMFSPHPLCCPARASFLTGQYSHNHGVWSHAEPYGFKALRDSSTLPVWLQGSGYDTTFIGKYLNRYGLQTARNGHPSVRYVPPGWTDWQASIDGGMPVGSPLDGSTYRYFDNTLNVNGRLEPHEGAYQTSLFGRILRHSFREQARSPRPFFAWVNFVAPHHGTPVEADDPRSVVREDGSLQSFATPARPKRVWGRFDRELRRVPGFEGEPDVHDKPFFIRHLPPLSKAEQAGVLADARQRAESLSLLDEQVAKLVRTLRQTGELDDTYVAFTSDNGYFLGEHRMRQGKTLPYEPSLRVPLVIRGPGIPRGQVRTDPFTMIDFAPTLLQAAGVGGPRRRLDGVSMLDVARDGDRGWSRGILTETGPRVVRGEAYESDNFLVESGGPSSKRFSQGVRTPNFLYVEHASHERELYDLRTDPLQLTNVVDRPRRRAVVRALAHELDVLRNCVGPECARPLPALLRP